MVHEVVYDKFFLQVGKPDKLFFWRLVGGGTFIVVAACDEIDQQYQEDGSSAAEDQFFPVLKNLSRFKKQEPDKEIAQSHRFGF
jgi:hypothetical protein